MIQQQEVGSCLKIAKISPAFFAAWDAARRGEADLGKCPSCAWKRKAKTKQVRVCVCVCVCVERERERERERE